MKPDMIQPLEEKQIFITSGEYGEREATCSNIVWAIQRVHSFICNKHNLAKSVSYVPSPCKLYFLGHKDPPLKSCKSSDCTAGRPAETEGEKQQRERLSVKTH